MQMFRPCSDEQSYTRPIQPFAKPASHQTRCLDTHLPGGYGKPHQAAAGGYGVQHGYGPTLSQIPWGQVSQQGTYGSVQHGGHGTTRQGSYSAVQQGGYGSADHGSFGTGHHGANDSIHHGSYGSGRHTQSGGCGYIKKKERQPPWRKRSGNDCDSSGSDESDDERR